MSNRDIYIENTPLAEALQRWHDVLARNGCLQPLQPETIPVDDALGRITATAVYAQRSSPFYNASAMDGIAVKHQDTIGASEARPVILSAEQYTAVNTGNVLPEGANAVVMIEDVQEVVDNRVEIITPTTPWQHVRTIGEDIVATELILPVGHRIRPIDQGAMLATGITEVKVIRIPRAVVIPTGSELVQPGQEILPGNIIEFNSRILAGYLTEWGAAVNRHPIVTDRPAVIKEAISSAVNDYDFIVINAGASAGTEDHTAGVIREMGQVIVHGVNIKPGKPVILGIVGTTPIVGLPGYPVSAIVNLRLFVQGLVNAMLGLDEPMSQYLSATLARPVASKLGVEEFLRVKLGRVGPNLMATPSGRGAGAVMSFVQADGILTIPVGSEGIGAGEEVRIELLRSVDEIDSTLVFIGSHDNILDILANELHQERPAVRLSSAHVGSMGGILAIKRGEAHLAGTHLLDEESGDYNVPFIKKYLAGVPLILMNLAYREQGLLVPRGNPREIKSFADLASKKVSFINRQRGTGTRLLTDMHLKRLGIPSDDIDGYDREEYTHMNVAQAVASGSVDTGLAIRAAAVALGLDFVPVAWERYDLIIPASLQEEPKIKALLNIVHGSKKFRATVEQLGGYDLRDSGKVMYEQ